MSQYEVGMKVLIIEDCREGSPCTGQIGTYEGMFPRRVLAQIDGEIGEYEHQSWMEWWEAAPDPKPARWAEGAPQPEGDS